MANIKLTSLICLVGFSADIERAGQFEGQIFPALASMGWEWRQIELTDALSGTPLPDKPAAVVVNGACEAIIAAAGAIKRSGSWPRGTPVLVLGGSDIPDSNGCLPHNPGPSTFLALLEHWCGPLRDHELRTHPFSPRYRMIRLLGYSEAQAMFERFVDVLTSVVTEGETNLTSASAHRMTGLAGMIGYTDLAAHWADVERGREGAIDEALHAAKALLLSLTS